MQYPKMYSAMLEGFDAPNFPKIVKVLNTILWTQHYNPRKIKEIMEGASQDKIELRRIVSGVQTSDGYVWPTGFFYSVKFSSVDDAAILFPHCQEEDLFDEQVRSVAIYLKSTLSGNRRFAVQNSLGELLIELCTTFVETVCNCQQYADA